MPSLKNALQFRLSRKGGKGGGEAFYPRRQRGGDGLAVGQQAAGADNGQKRLQLVQGIFPRAQHGDIGAAVKKGVAHGAIAYPRPLKFGGVFKIQLPALRPGSQYYRPGKQLFFAFGARIRVTLAVPAGVPFTSGVPEKPAAAGFSRCKPF